MEIKAHLTDAEMSDALFQPGPALVVHLEQCDACWREVEALRKALRQPALADRPAEFWDRQRRSIHGRIDAPQKLRPLRSRWVLALSTAVVAVACFLLRSAPSPPPPAAQADPDHELLMEVEYLVGSDVPQSLEPASLLAAEISQGAPAKPDHDHDKGDRE